MLQDLIVVLLRWWPYWLLVINDVLASESLLSSLDTASYLILKYID